MKTNRCHVGRSFEFNPINLNKNNTWVYKTPLFNEIEMNFKVFNFTADFLLFLHISFTTLLFSFGSLATASLACPILPTYLIYPHFFLPSPALWFLPSFTRPLISSFLHPLSHFFLLSPALSPLPPKPNKYEHFKC